MPSSVVYKEDNRDPQRFKSQFEGKIRLMLQLKHLSRESMQPSSTFCSV